MYSFIKGNKLVLVVFALSVIFHAMAPPNTTTNTSSHSLFEIVALAHSSLSGPMVLIFGLVLGCGILLQHPMAMLGGTGMALFFVFAIPKIAAYLSPGADAYFSDASAWHLLYFFIGVVSGWPLLKYAARLSNRRNQQAINEWAYNRITSNMTSTTTDEEIAGLISEAEDVANQHGLTLNPDISELVLQYCQARRTKG